jgi:hypothetical protein
MLNVGGHADRVKSGTGRDRQGANRRDYADAAAFKEAAMAAYDKPINF